MYGEFSGHRHPLEALISIQPWGIIACTQRTDVQLVAEQGQLSNG